jgi:hypothetical protein
MMGSPNSLMDQMCGGDLKYPNESYSPKHGGMFADPRGNEHYVLFIILVHNIIQDLTTYISQKIYCFTGYSAILYHALTKVRFFELILRSLFFQLLAIL